MIRYYAVARDEQGRVAQVLVTREHGQQVSQEWTGVTYKNERDAARDLERLNCPTTRFVFDRDMMGVQVLRRVGPA